MKIDLHLHSPMSALNGDSIKWISVNSTIKTLFNKGIKAFAFTDHNIFDKKLYLEAKTIVKGNMFIYPGVEVDVIKRDGAKAHILIIFPDNLSEDQIEDIYNESKLKLRKSGVSIETLSNLFNKFETIRIPHVGKSDYFKPNELHEIDHDAIETTSTKNPNYMKWVKQLSDKSVVSFSDTHIWRDYPQQSFLYTEIDYDGTFKDLKSILKECKTFSKRRI
ncbi:PHP domain-containing protein [Candidatus Mycoplasma mahonii]|uniref:PHP domain-containing protein n=1 Tax=Candidatus Mycoplasma mahonii TaxID=3004105 RepID=UPI0026F23C95|nr:PHP domain-containing protein [Candidatus Mycoplasma mahonii]WKX02768.1 PHP domain-containing protein [Candidatus Mycoplasma mahonii]